MVKTVKFIVFLLISMTSNLIASENNYETLYQNENILLLYDVANRSAQLKSNEKSYDFSLVSNEKINEALNLYKSEFPNLDEQDRLMIEKELHRFRYLLASDYALHFKMGDRSGIQIPIISEYIENKSFAEYSEQSFQSIYLATIIPYQDEREIILRLIVNRNGGIERFAFIDEYNKLDKFEITMSSANEVSLMGPENKTWINFKKEKINDDEFKVILGAPKIEGSLNVGKDYYFRLQKRDGEWTLDNLKKVGESKAEGPTVQVQTDVNSYDYEDTNSENSIEAEKLFYIAFDDFAGQLRRGYIRAEQIDDIDTEDFEQDLYDDFKDYYLPLALEGVIFLAYEDYENCLTESFILNEDLDEKSCYHYAGLQMAYRLLEAENQESEFKSCLQEKSIIKEKNQHKFFSLEGVRDFLDDGHRKSDFSYCFPKDKLSVETVITSGIKKNDDIKNVLGGNQEEVSRLADRVVKEGYEACSARLQENKTQCLSSFLDSALQVEIFLSYLSIEKGLAKETIYQEIQICRQEELESFYSASSRRRRRKGKKLQEKTFECIKNAFLEKHNFAFDEKVRNLFQQVDFIKNHDVQFEESFIGTIARFSGECTKDAILGEESERFTREFDTIYKLLNFHEIQQAECSLEYISKSVHRYYDVVVKKNRIQALDESPEAEEEAISDHVDGFRAALSQARGDSSIIGDGDIKSPDDINRIASDSFYQSMSLDLFKAMRIFLDRYFSTEDWNYEFYNREARDKVFKQVFKKLGGTEGEERLFGRYLSDKLKEIRERSGRRGVESYSKDLVRDTAALAIPHIINRDYKEEADNGTYDYVSPEARTIGELVLKDTLDCLQAYNPSTTQTGIYQYIDSCIFKAKAADVYHNFKEQIVSAVALHLTPGSPDGNRVLGQFRGCIERAMAELIQENPGVDFKDIYYAGRVNGCIAVSQLDISKKGVSNKIVRFDQVISKTNEQRAQSTMNSCVANIYSRAARELGNSAVSRNKDLFAKEIGRYDDANPPGEITEKGGMAVWLSDQVRLCYVEAESLIMNGFKQHLIDKYISAAVRQQINDTDRGEDEEGNKREQKTNGHFIQLAIDTELLGLLASVQLSDLPRYIEGNKDRAPAEQVITKQLTLDMMENGARLMGKYLEAAFIFNNEATAHELQTFVEDLKRFLRLILVGDKTYHVDDLKHHFNRTRLSTIVALGVASKFTFERYRCMLEMMRADEIKGRSPRRPPRRSRNRSRTSQRTEERRTFDCGKTRQTASVSQETAPSSPSTTGGRGRRPRRLTPRVNPIHKRINEKYDRLIELSREATSGQRFYQIINPTRDTSGETLVTYIKYNFLFPGLVEPYKFHTEGSIGLVGDVVGRVMTYVQTYRNINILIASKMVGRDEQSDGGFAEQFAGEIAQSHLDLYLHEKWFGCLRQFFFYDRDDFDWEALRQTESGDKAIKFWANTFVLYNVYGKEISAQQQKEWGDRFYELIQKAQGEYKRRQDNGTGPSSGDDQSNWMTTMELWRCIQEHGVI